MALPESFITIPIAHRGLHGPGVPENSLAAVRAAARRKPSSSRTLRNGPSMA